MKRSYSLYNNIIILFYILMWGTFLGCTRSSELEWHQEEGHRWTEISSGFFGSTGFRNHSSSRTGINFVNRITEEEIAENRHYLNGSGVAAGDIDGDGLVDLYFAGLNSSNKLYKNLGGMKFEDITDQAGVAHEGVYSTGAVFADVNGNGHLDLLVTAMHGENTLYLNDGNGNFARSENSGLGAAKGSNTMALADITGNGYPDLYITRYKERSVKDIYTTQELDWSNILAEPLRQPTDHYTLIPPFDEHYELVRQDGALTGISEIGRVDELYLNNGGRFDKVIDTESTFLDADGQPFGLQPDWGLTAKFQDLNNDGFQDLYVCNDFHTPDRIWVNQGDPSGDGQVPTFRAIGWQAIRNLSYSCMAVDFSDVNRDGRQDIFTTEMLDTEHHRRLSQVGSLDHVSIPVGDIESRPLYNRNSMYLQREDGTFAETAWLSGVEATGWSWATRFMDVDLDGYEDLIVTTGYLYNILDIDAQYAMIRNRRNMDEHFMEFVELVEPLELQNRLLRNNGVSPGEAVPTFTDVSSDWGFSDPDVSQGMAVADLNNDGVLDVIINRMNEEAVIFENRTNAPRIAVRLKGKSPNTQAIGSKVELNGGPVLQTQEISVGGEYASGSDPLVVFAANPDNPDHTIQITWPDGATSLIDSVKANRMYEIDQASMGQNENQPSKGFEPLEGSQSLFKDSSNILNHAHHEGSFRDFEIQPLIPMKLSQQGPGMAWLDLTGNGNDDLLISSGKGGRFTVLENLGNNQFQSKEIEGLTETTSGDQTAVIGWGEEDYTRVMIGSSNYEQGRSGAPSVHIFRVYPDLTVEKDSIPSVHSTTGPLAAADVTGNGYLDLFIGGNFKPGQYPADADSRFFRNEAGTMQLDRANSQVLAGLGLVNGAVFNDFNQNGYQDLLVSTEWGSLRLFEYNDGFFKEITSEVGLDAWSGWWKGVATGDFNNDGLPDIVATNIGLNTPYQLQNGYPLRIYYNDLSGLGRMDIFEAYADEQGNYLPRHRLYKFQEQQIMLNRMGSHKEFANSTLKQVLGNRYDQISYKEINTLEHMIFINTGSGFEARPLPQEAQSTMAFHPGVTDVTNDGNEDLFLSQNFFGVSEDISRMDTGRGLLLKGDGNGNFRTLSGTESGVKIYGEQRGSAFSDINSDGRVDLAVSQNGAQTKLYLNQNEKSGYSIRLQGPASNRNGVGSNIRLVYEDGEKGPRRDFHSGAGYWSQNGYTQIMGAKKDVQAIEIHWFDGTRQTVTVVEGKRDYTVLYPVNN